MLFKKIAYDTSDQLVIDTVEGMDNINYKIQPGERTSAISEAINALKDIAYASMGLYEIQKSGVLEIAGVQVIPRGFVYEKSKGIECYQIIGHYYNDFFAKSVEFKSPKIVVPILKIDEDEDELIKLENGACFFLDHTNGTVLPKWSCTSVKLFKNVQILAERLIKSGDDQLDLFTYTTSADKPVDTGVKQLGTGLRLETMGEVEEVEYAVVEDAGHQLEDKNAKYNTPEAHAKIKEANGIPLDAEIKVSLKEGGDELEIEILGNDEAFEFTEEA
jgi:hypothetical protein